MKHAIKSIRPFIGAKNFEESRQFYTDLRFEESVISKDLSYFKSAAIGFYLQNAYVKDWIDNLMVFVEVDDVARYRQELEKLALPDKYAQVRLTAIREEHWGRECFLHDPSGILWHFGEFY
jgi:catechol 2,3-dioxygenase-like lactoylglutathione lyase family enzyme